MNRSGGKGKIKEAGDGEGREMGFEPEVLSSLHTVTSTAPAHSSHSTVFKSHALLQQTNNGVKLKRELLQGTDGLLSNSLIQPFNCSTDSIGHLLWSGTVLGTAVPALTARSSRGLSLLWANPAIRRGGGCQDPCRGRLKPKGRALATGDVSKGMQASRGVQVSLTSLSHPLHWTK